jgi:hypothetical protein
MGFKSEHFSIAAYGAPRLSFSRDITALCGLHNCACRLDPAVSAHIKGMKQPLYSVVLGWSSPEWHTGGHSFMSS